MLTGVSGNYPEYSKWNSGGRKIYTPPLQKRKKSAINRICQKKVGKTKREYFQTKKVGDQPDLHATLVRRRIGEEVRSVCGNHGTNVITGVLVEPCLERGVCGLRGTRAHMTTDAGARPLWRPLACFSSIQSHRTYITPVHITYTRESVVFPPKVCTTRPVCREKGRLESRIALQKASTFGDSSEHLVFFNHTPLRRMEYA